MSNQERLDKIENLALQAGGHARLFNYLNFEGKHPSLQQLENTIGDLLVEVLALKKDLGCTSTLSIVGEQE